jgi:hypothetical protein
MPDTSGAAHALSPTLAARFARRALANIAREYPNHPQLLLESDEDLKRPRDVHPCFFGCFDWHSAVHSHWLLVRVLRAPLAAATRAAIEAALSESFRTSKTRVEAQYLARHRTFERPYGIAWLALLAAEVTNSRASPADRWRRALRPLAAVGRENALRWLAVLRHPVRSGTHNQTAFALTLLLDAARARRDRVMQEAVQNAALSLYADDADSPLRYEPSGEDFLSPVLMEADLMRRVLRGNAYSSWLARFLPDLPRREIAGWLDCAAVVDERDGKLVHPHGLNLSRAWNLANIAAALPARDPRIAALRSAARRHRAAGVRAAIASRHYATDHWLPTFAVYLLTEASRPPG